MILSVERYTLNETSSVELSVHPISILVVVTFVAVNDIGGAGVIGILEINEMLSIDAGGSVPMLVSLFQLNINLKVVPAKLAGSIKVAV